MRVFIDQYYTKNCIYELTKVYSNIVINECDYSKVEVPRYWKLSSRHENKVRALIKDSYGSLSRFYKDEALIVYWRKCK